MLSKVVLSFEGDDVCALNDELLFVVGCCCVVCCVVSFDAVWLGRWTLCGTLCVVVAVLNGVLDGLARHCDGQIARC